MENRKNPYQKFEEEKAKTPEQIEEERINKIFLDGMLRKMKQDKYI